MECGIADAALRPSGAAEQEQHQRISDALVKEGIIPKDQVHSHPEPPARSDGGAAPQP